MAVFFNSIETEEISFSTSETFARNIFDEIGRSNSLVEQQEIGQSEEGRSIYAFTAGRGDKHIALLGGAHSDEPVGPEMLRLLVKNFINNEEPAKSLFQAYTFLIIPHINPDGEMKNWQWMKDWPDISCYAAHAFREEPGRDLEFGYPDMRTENRAVAEIFEQYAPFDLYINFHGMAFAEGIMLLIERHWIEQTQQLRNGFINIAEEHNLSLHDHDRKREKGFEYIGPGFTTTPEGRAMQQYFKEKGDEETASKFHLSSMEYVRSLGGNPLCLVTELPLYMVTLKEGPENVPGVPRSYLEFKKRVPELRKRAVKRESLDPILNRFEITHLPLQKAVRIQLTVIKKALQMLQNT